jgi:UDP-N-acetylglucosamine 2-epimerase (non-hydrolysing)
LREGVPAASVHVTGNTVIDALIRALEIAMIHSPAVMLELGEVANLPMTTRIVLITGHRRESYGEGISRICQAILLLAKNYPDIHFVYSVHPNPSVRQPVERILNADKLTNVHLINPLSYLAFVYLMSRSYIIITDSGGVQEEAPSLVKPVLVMRDITERPESVDAGCSILFGTNEVRIVYEATRLLAEQSAYERMSRVQNPYGDGLAARRIIIACERFLFVKD